MRRPVRAFHHNGSNILELDGNKISDYPWFTFDDWVAGSWTHVIGISLQLDGEMRIASFTRGMTAVAVAATSSLPAWGQGAAIVPEAVQVATVLRSRGTSGLAFTLLTQSEKSLPRASLDAIADSLAAYAISFNYDRSSDRSSRAAALFILSSSGLASSRIPYDGAAERLLRVAENALDFNDRIIAANSLALLANRAAAVSAFRKLATSQNIVAFIAVRELGGAMAPYGGLDVLRELDRGSLVMKADARRELEFIARKQGWRTPFSGL